MTTDNKVKSTNWQPEHFPIGTTVTLEKYVNDNGKFRRNTEGPRAIVTVCDIIADGVDSFLIQTEFFNEALGIFRTFNFDDIGSIIKRGTGPVKVVKYRGDSKPVCVNALLPNNLLNTNRYYFRTSYEILSYLASLTSLPKNLYLKEGFFEFLVSQSFVKKTDDSYFHGSWVYNMNKKRARRFVRQNINRWIKPMKLVRAEAEREAKEENARYYEDMESDFDSSFKNEEGDLQPKTDNFNTYPAPDDSGRLFKGHDTSHVSLEGKDDPV